jgi:hypothetical protein
LVGVGSSGKSNVARHLNRADVREFHLNEKAKHVLNLYVNCTKLAGGDYTARELHCLILEVITKTVRDAQLGGGRLWLELKALWKEAITFETAALARFNLDDAFYMVFEVGDIKQIFITLDDFDSVVVQASGPVLNSLRTFRDDNKNKIMYVTVTRRELQFLRDPIEFEELFELLGGNIIPVGPYTEADARDMIKRLAARESSSQIPSDEEFDRLQECLLVLSGRHAGLIRTIYRLAQGQMTLSNVDLLDRLRTAPHIKAECEKIWVSLGEGEQDVLETLVSEDEQIGQDLWSLRKKGIMLDKSDGVNRVFSPVFANYIVDEQPVLRPRMELLSERRIKIDHRVIDELNRVEYHLLYCLCGQQPEPLSWEQLLDEMGEAEAGDPECGGSPEHRLDTYLEGIKHKIELGAWEHVLRLSDGSCKLQISYRLPKAES